MGSFHIKPVPDAASPSCAGDRLRSRGPSEAVRAVADVCQWRSKLVKLSVAKVYADGRSGIVATRRGVNVVRSRTLSPPATATQRELSALLIVLTEAAVLGFSPQRFSNTSLASSQRDGPMAIITKFSDEELSLSQHTRA